MHNIYYKVSEKTELKTIYEKVLSLIKQTKEKNWTILLNYYDSFLCRSHDIVFDIFLNCLLYLNKLSYFELVTTVANNNFYEFSRLCYLEHCIGMKIF